MNELLRTLKLALAVCALPLAAAIAAAQPWTLQEAAAVAQNASATTLESRRSHSVHVTADGAVEGRVVAIDSTSRSYAPLAEIEVHFVQDGVSVAQVMTDADGRFVVDALVPGKYSFIASGPRGFAAYGVMVLPAEVGATSDLEIIAPALSPRFVALKRIVEQNLEPSRSVLDVNTDLQATEVVAGTHRVALQGEELHGAVHSLVDGLVPGGTNVYLVQNDQTVAEGVADAAGQFVISGVKPGVYEFVAAGSAGFAAVGFEAISQDEVQEAAQQIPPGEAVPATFDVTLTLPSDSRIIVQQVDAAKSVQMDSEVIASSGALPIDMYGDVISNGAAAGSCGCAEDSDYYGGGCGGCGGGVGGFGGMGDLAGLALAGGILVALIDQLDNDDDFPNRPPPVSPRN